MLVTDPKQRATLHEIMNHPWITKGFNCPPENFLPQREPLQMPLDPHVIEKMTGFEFGSADFIRKQLENILESEDYQRAVRNAARRSHGQQAESDKKRASVFDFYQRRKSASSRDALANASSETIHLGEDPTNAYAPLISVYYLAREKMDREKIENNPGGLSIPHSPGEKHLRLPDLPAPEAAVTNSSSYEMAGEVPTGGRSRPRARTHGEDEIREGAAAAAHSSPSTSVNPTRRRSPGAKRESAAVGLLRRFSTRKHKDMDNEKTRVNTPPSLAVSSPEDTAAPTRQSFSIRKTRDRDTPPSAYKNIAENHPDLLAPPNGAETTGRKLKGLGRSTSVNSADLKRRWSRRGVSEGTALRGKSGAESEKSSLLDRKPGVTEEVSSDQEDTQSRSRSVAHRTRSTGHPRRNSFQQRRSRPSRLQEEDLPEETDKELAEELERGQQGHGSQEVLKPIYLKGLFSVSTTSSKPVPVIRTDIIRVLKELGVEYKEMKGGFNCRHVPSIDVNKVKDEPASSDQPLRSVSHTHRRKISFAGLRSNERDRDEHTEHQQKQATPKSTSRRPIHDGSYTNSEDSDDENATRQSKRSPRAAGETTTHVQSDLGSSMILKFEILVVKIPLLSLHGLQFKKVDGGTWQYKRMAETILKELRL